MSRNKSVTYKVIMPCYSAMGEYLDSLPDLSDPDDWPLIDLVSDHLPSWQMPMFYKVCDAFVLPTHGEGERIRMTVG